jgi:sarcosine oxidase subunit beta
VNAEVVVLGAGIIGTAIARQLARAGMDVVMVDVGAVGGGTSSRGEGNVLLSAKHDSLGVEMTLYSIDRYRQWTAELGPELHFEQAGSLMFCSDPADTETFAERTKWLNDHGVAAEFLETAQLLEREPNLAGRIFGGIDCLGDASVYPPGVVTALARDARRHGCRILPHTRARRLLVSGEAQVTGVETDAGTVSASKVINAMGAWSQEFAHGPATHIPVAPRQGLLAVTDEAPGLIRRQISEGSYITTRVSPGDGAVPGVAFTAEPTFRGNVLIGSTRRFCGDDVEVDLPLLRTMMRRAVSFLPALANIQIIRTYAGLRPWTPDNRPIIGRSDTVQGYLVATGHEGEGIGLAPITADIIESLVTGGTLTPIFEKTLAVTNPERFAGKQTAGRS